LNSFKKFINFQIWIDDVERKDIQVNSKDTGSGIYDVDVFTQLKRDDVKDDSDVVCEVNIPNSEYKSSETITYDGKNYS
jgi:hypothetical protein